MGFSVESEPIQIPKFSSRIVNVAQKSMQNPGPTYKCPLCPVVLDLINPLKRHLDNIHQWAVLSIYDHAFRQFFCFYFQKLKQTWTIWLKQTTAQKKEILQFFSPICLCLRIFKKHQKFLKVVIAIFVLVTRQGIRKKRPASRFERRVLERPRGSVPF